MAWIKSSAHLLRVLGPGTEFSKASGPLQLLFLLRDRAGLRGGRLCNNQKRGLLRRHQGGQSLGGHLELKSNKKVGEGEGKGGEKKRKVKEGVSGRKSRLVTLLTSFPQSLLGSLSLQNRNIAKISQCRFAECCPKTRESQGPVPFPSLQAAWPRLKQEGGGRQQGGCRRVRERASDNEIQVLH